MGPDLRRLQRLEALTFRTATAHGARFDTGVGSLEVEAYAPGIVRLRLTAAGGAPPRDYGLLAAEPDPPGTRFTAEAGRHRLEAGPLVLDLTQHPLRLRLTLEGRPVLESTGDAHISGGLRVPPFALGDGEHGPWWSAALDLRSGEPVYGLGEKFGPLNHRGQLVTSWNEDALGVNTELSYKNVPFAWSPEGWGLFVHTPARVVHGVGYPQWSQRSYVLQVEDAVLDLFLLAGETPAAVIERYTYLTGRAPLPPRWSFGVWMSRCYYRTADEALEAARGLRERRIPCEVLTLDGRAWLKVETRFGFEWDRDRYPDPQAFAAQLRALDFRLCVWEYPYVSVHNPLFGTLAERGHLLRTEGGEPCVLEWDPTPFGELLTPLPPSGMVDFTHPDAYQWYQEAHRSLFAAGVDVIKTDFGEQIPSGARAANGDDGRRLHNVYPLLFNRCVYEASAARGPDGALVWGRSGWTGSQRYPIQWGGDPQADWEGLAASIRGGLSWGMSGVPYHSHDIGGFYHLAPGQQPDAELYVRWAQAGVMASHTRFHGTSPREPWHYGAEAEDIVRRWLQWRYRLFPYLEACALEAHRRGMPVMRAMPLAYPHDPAAWGFEEQYLLGPSLLVAPVVRPGGRIRLYLPDGGWFALDTGAREQGPRVVERAVPLDQLPLYGREGHLLPLGPPVQHSGEIPADGRLNEVWVFGLPRHGIDAPGLTLEVTGVQGAVRLAGLPEEARVRAFGDVAAERSGGAHVLLRAGEA